MFIEGSFKVLINSKSLAARVQATMYLSCVVLLHGDRPKYIQNPADFGERKRERKEGQCEGEE